MEDTCLRTISDCYKYDIFIGRITTLGPLKYTLKGVFERPEDNIYKSNVEYLLANRCRPSEMK